MDPARHFRGPLALGLSPLVVASLFALARLVADSPSMTGGAGLTARAGALFALTIAFAFYALSRYPALHLLPAMWAILLLIEFVISPVHDILRGL
jgi:hypothetical protein